MRKILAILLVSAMPSLGAISANSVFEVRTTGSDSNGGFFVTGSGGTDYSQQDSCQATGTVTSASTTVTATSNIFTSAMVGNGITDGTIWREIKTVTPPNVLTVDAAPSWTAASICVGGALASPGKAAGLMVGGNVGWLKYSATPYSVTTTSSNLANGVISLPAGGVSSDTSLVGYQTTRGDYGLSPLIQASGISGTFTLITGTTKSFVAGVSIDCASLGTGIGVNGVTWLVRSKVSNCTSVGVGTSTGNAVAVEAVSCATGIRAVNAIYCVAHGCSTTGFRSQFDYYSISYSNSGAGFQISQTGMAVGCIAYGNTGAGFSDPGGNQGVFFINSIAVNNTGAGFSGTSNVNSNYFQNCAAYNNTGGTGFGSGGVQIGTITLSGDPYVSGSTGNFALSLTGTAYGSPLKAAGYPATMPGGSTANYADVNAVQHQDSGGGNTYIFPIFK